jgi:hypothetical protein
MTDGKMSMRFFLPMQYSKQNAPEPNDERVRIIDLPTEYFAVISYSGFASDGNFEEHYTKLKAALGKDGMVIKGSPIKATYNSPFTLPFLRRNEAMYPLEWNYAMEKSLSSQVRSPLKVPAAFSHLLVLRLYGIRTTSSSDKQILPFGSLQPQRFYPSKFEAVHLQSTFHSHVLE